MRRQFQRRKGGTRVRCQFVFDKGKTTMLASRVLRHSNEFQLAKGRKQLLQFGNLTIEGKNI